MNKLNLTTFAFLTLAGAAARVHAAIAMLDLQIDPAAKSWKVFASLTAASDGLASFSLDVTGAGGAAVVSSQLQAPRPYDPALEDFIGFRLFRSNGTAGLDIRASQDTVSGDSTLLLMDLGGGSPVLLAGGTYSGDAGTLTASVHPGAFFNVFPDGYVAGGSTAPATQVIADTMAVPEPSMFALLAGALLVARRRRARG